MKNAAEPTAKRSTVLSYFSLFTSLSTLLCCALPSLLVLFGLGASVLSFFPWLVALARHKVLTFGISGALIAWSFINTYYILPRFAAQECRPNNPNACAEASRLSRTLLWVSATIYVIGFFVAFVLGPILSKIDNA